VKFCLVVGGLQGDTSSNYSVYTSGQWMSGGSIDSGKGQSVLAALSCVSSQACWAVDGNGRVDEYEGSGWTSPTQIDPYSSDVGLSSISCPTTSSCVAVGGAGEAILGR
jgi:hypothetical protein